MLNPYQFFIDTYSSLEDSFKRSIIEWGSFSFKDWQLFNNRKSINMFEPIKHSKEINLSYTFVPNKTIPLEDSISNENEMFFKMGMNEFHSLMHENQIFEWFPVDPFYGLASVSRKINIAEAIQDTVNFKILFNSFDTSQTFEGGDLFDNIWVNNYDLIYNHYKDNPIEIARHKLIRNIDFADKMRCLNKDPDIYVIWRSRYNLAEYEKESPDEKE